MFIVAKMKVEFDKKGFKLSFNDVFYYNTVTI